MSRPDQNDVASSGPPASISVWAEGMKTSLQRDWENAEAGFLLAILQNVKNPLNPKYSFIWNAHDGEIRLAVDEYNLYLGSTPGFRALDWHFVKAMTFVEIGPDGAGRGRWERQPLPLVNGLYQDFMNSPMRDLIVPPYLRRSLALASSCVAGNIAAGVGYMLFRMAIFGETHRGWAVNGWQAIDAERVCSVFKYDCGVGRLGFAFDLIKSTRFLK